MNNSERVQLKLDVLRELGTSLSNDTVILDFGCGEGADVTEFRKRGYTCFGCDFTDVAKDFSPRLHAKGILRQIANPYRIPFGDASFDVICSESVLEHVHDYDSAFTELSRVLKPGGICLHVFPARYNPIEVHVKVPFAGCFRTRWWLMFWARVGIRSQSQRHLSYRETTIQNWKYLHRRTNYLTRRELTRHCRDHFNAYRFCTKELLKYHPRMKGPFSTLHRVPGIPKLLDMCHRTVLGQWK